MKIPFNIFDLMPDIEIQIACHPFYINDSYRVLSTFVKNTQYLSPDDFEDGSTEIIMLCSRFGKVTKIKAIVDKYDNDIGIKTLENGGQYYDEETHPIDTFIVEILEKPFLTAQDILRNQEAYFYLEHMADTACEFYRLAIDNRLIQRKYTKSKKYKASKVIIDSQTRVEANILWKAWAMFQRIAILENGAIEQDAIVESFRNLIFEGLLLMPTLLIHRDPGLTKTEVVKNIQNENKLLTARYDSDIPFPDRSFSHEFIKLLFELANKDLDFYKDYYRPLIKAREQLPACLLKGSNGIKLYGKLVKPERRGRPPGNKKAKTLS